MRKWTGVRSGKAGERGRENYDTIGATISSGHSDHMSSMMNKGLFGQARPSSGSLHVVVLYKHCGRARRSHSNSAPTAPLRLQVFTGGARADFRRATAMDYLSWRLIFKKVIF